MIRIIAQNEHGHHHEYSVLNNIDDDDDDDDDDHSEKIILIFSVSQRVPYIILIHSIIDVYDLMIKNIRFEDEGEYACQARLVKKTNSQHRPYYLYQFVNQSKFYRKSIKSNMTNHFDSSIHDLFNLPMSLIKSNTAYLNVIGKLTMK
ncbi:unnamed protein product [Schistosoma mattheei]|uniref:Uncharacterized protein n=1 Tax=Schistosoma mattheei TaxID=31246 RepID=A0A183Q3D7_9TREM|nr:unnamed protein product [Schistosoma mattheei]